MGYGFRVAEWLIGGATPRAAWSVLKFDVLQCIGLTLMISALIAAPRDTQPGGRLPYKSLLAALVVALTTPLLQGLGRPHGMPTWLSYVLWGGHDLAPFPLFPWLSYTLSGCFVGAYLLRGAAQNRLGRTIAIMAILGAVVAIIGKIGGRIDIPIYRPTEAVPIPATPVSYLFRTGTCLVGLAAAYWIDRWRSRPSAAAASPPSAWTRFAPLLWLGQASMTVYMVHIDLVYNIWTYPLRHKLGPWTATLVLFVLNVAMVWLAYRRTAGATKRQSRRVPLTTTPAAALASATKSPTPAVCQLTPRSSYMNAKKYRCVVCDHIYEPANGDPSVQHPAGHSVREAPRRLGLPRLRRRQGRLRAD